MMAWGGLMQLDGCGGFEMDGTGAVRPSLQDGKGFGRIGTPDFMRGYSHWLPLGATSRGQTLGVGPQEI